MSVSVRPRGRRKRFLSSRDRKNLYLKLAYLKCNPSIAQLSRKALQQPQMLDYSKRGENRFRIAACDEANAAML
jgi:hypothetical protein